MTGSLKAVPISEVCEINPGFDRNSVKDEELVSFVPMAAVDEKRGAIAQEAGRLLKEVSKGFTPFREWDVLFAKITPCMENGKSAIARNLKNGCGFGSTEFHVLRSKGTILPEWVHFFIRRPAFRHAASKNMTGSAGQKRVPRQFFDRALIPVPPLAVQKEMVSMFGSVESALEKRREAIRLLDDFLKSTFLEMFGDPSKNPKKWAIKKIGDVLAFSQYGTSRKSNNEKRGYLVLGMGNITGEGHLDLTNVNCVEMPVEEFKNLKLEKSDIIFNRTNSTELVGKTTCWNRAEQAVLASYLVKLRLKPEVRPEFFSFLLNTAYYKKLFMRRCKKAVGQSNISPTLLRGFEIFVPPMGLQKKFAELIDRTEALKQKMKSSETELQNLFNSLMQEAFNGRLT